MQTLQSYIFRILQHFATKPCHSTNFNILSSCSKRFRSSCVVRPFANCLFILFIQQDSRTNVASIGGPVKSAQKHMIFQSRKRYEQNSTFLAKTLHREVSIVGGGGGGVGENAHVFIRVNTKASRSEIKANRNIKIHEY